MKAQGMVLPQKSATRSQGHDLSFVRWLENHRVFPGVFPVKQVLIFIGDVPMIKFMIITSAIYKDSIGDVPMIIAIYNLPGFSHTKPPSFTVMGTHASPMARQNLHVGCPDSPSLMTGWSADFLRYGIIKCSFYGNLRVILNENLLGSDGGFTGDALLAL
jgi:hypothetical protein